ncbi:MAG: ribosome small subunit-dependent GTPase A [Clostridia bacterium]|nr:MAG: ribosome small subunit-dependent GTPase A [Clostridia bacterium]
MLEGVIFRGRGGFYDVRVGQERYRCTLRGRLRYQDQDILVGDQVRVRVLRTGEGVIEEVLPRKSKLIRPAVANVDQAVVVVGLAEPSPDLALLDRLLVMAEAEGLKKVICLNKADLVTEAEADLLRRMYVAAGYRTLVTSAKSRRGIEDLRQLLAGQVNVFAGPSGAGKSSLLNALQPGLRLKTEEVSTKIGRGRHTTRHVELLDLDGGGMVADTPGFSQLRLPDIPRENLGCFFPEMDAYQGRCRFTSCLHSREPDCAVRAAVSRREIARSRYDHYLEFLEELTTRERSF